MEDNINQTKQINIIGTTNRYQIIKLTTHTTKKKRIISSKWNIQEKYYDKDRLDKVLDNFWANLIRENLDMGIWKLEDLHLHMRKLNNAEDFILFLVAGIIIIIIKFISPKLIY